MLQVAITSSSSRAGTRRRLSSDDPANQEEERRGNEKVKVSTGRGLRVVLVQLSRLQAQGY